MAPRRAHAWKTGESVERTQRSTRPAAAEIRLSTGDGRSGGGGDTGVLAHASSGAAARLKLGQLVRVRLRNVDKGGRVEVEVIG